MSPRGVVLASVLLAVPADARPAAEEPVEKRTLAGTAEEFCNEPRRVWCGYDQELPFSLLAGTRAAPVLWFSPDEPLIRHENRKRKVPQPIRCGSQDPLSVPPGGEPAVVYYQVSQVLLGGPPSGHAAARDSLRAQKLPLAAVRKLTLKYFFYYEEDLGFGAHVHDLEGVEMQVEVEAHKSIAGLRRIRLLSVKGNAHGSDWQANILHLPDDTILPLTILVEEGKHASCPDRNGDGLYTPGYDVNIRTHDAWGVRDIFGSRFAGSLYHTEQFKPRLCKPREFGPRAAAGPGLDAGDADSADCPYRVGPALAEAPPPADTPMAAQWKTYEQRGLKPPTAKGYELRSAHALPPCPPVESPDLVRGPTFLDIGKRMREVRFGELEPVLHANKLSFRYGRPLILQPLRSLALGVSEGGRAAASLSVYSPQELQIVGGWPFVRGGLTLEAPHETTFELGYTPSISRLTDWYVTAGFRRASVAEENGAGTAWDWRTEGEVGVQVKWRVLGFRLGGRARISHFRLKESRVVLELVVGPFPGGSARGKE